MSGYRFLVETDSPGGDSQMVYDGDDLSDAVAAWREVLDGGTDYATLEALRAIGGPPPPHDVPVTGGRL